MAPIVTDGNLDVDVDVVVDVDPDLDPDRDASIPTFFARTSPKRLVGLLFASRLTDARDQVHFHDYVHVHVHDHDHVHVDALTVFAAPPIALSRFLQVL